MVSLRPQWTHSLAELKIRIYGGTHKIVMSPSHAELKIYLFYAFVDS